MPDREEFISSFSGTQIDSSVSKVLSDDVKDTTARNSIATLQSTINGMSAVSLGAVPQYSTLPTAAAQWVNKIVQYVGSTASGRTQGYFYKCNQSGSTYSWGAINVQANLTVDSAMSTTSTNPVQNKIAKAAIDAVQTNLNTEITNRTNAVSGITGAKGAANGYASLDANTKVTAAQASARVQSASSSKTLALADAGTFIYVSSTSNLTITIPTNASVAFPVGTEIEFCRWNTGAVTFAAASGVTLVSANSLKSISVRYATAGLKQVAANTWLLSGSLA